MSLYNKKMYNNNDTAAKQTAFRFAASAAAASLKNTQKLSYFRSRLAVCKPISTKLGT